MIIDSSSKLCEEETMIKVEKCVEHKKMDQWSKKKGLEKARPWATTRDSVVDQSLGHFTYSRCFQSVGNLPSEQFNMSIEKKFKVFFVAV